LARNGSGTYTKVNTFVAGNSITAAGHNQNFDDIASEITNSVAADGQTSMTGPLKASSGTAAAPSLTFGSDPDSGIYRAGSNNIGVSVNGAKVLDVATTGLTVTGTVEGTAVKQSGFALLPVGVIFPYGASSPPAGYLNCDGSPVSRTTYAALFAVIGTSYGAGDGSTTFRVPELRGRVPAGREAVATLLTATHFGGDSTVLGATGGLESHTLTTAQLASHSHANSLTDPGHDHSIDVGSSGGGSTQVTQGVAGVNATVTGPVNSNTTGISITNASAGSGSAHNNVQPTLITNYIIFAGV